MAFITRSGDHAARQVALEFIPEAAAAAQADTGVRGFKVRFVVDIAEAQRPGIEAVLSGVAVEAITAPSSWV